MTVEFPVVGGAQLTARRSECERLDRLIEAVRVGESRALVVRGEPGVGKTALLDYVAEHASDCLVARAAGVQSEMELAFAGVHQLCAPIVDHLDRLPGPQRDALRPRWASQPCSVRATPPNTATASRLRTSRALPPGLSWPAVICSTANGSGASGVAPTRARSCASPTTCSTR